MYFFYFYKKTVFMYFQDEEGKLPWPIASDINTRLRRIIAGYQRKHKMEQQKLEIHAKVW